MILQSTFDQLLLMAYGELDPTDARALQEQIMADNALAQEWYAILRLTGELDHMISSPSETSLRIVLDHSYKTEHLQEI
jgi:anti-sigma factor RsiW